MRLSERKLREIIKEEVGRAVLNEQQSRTVAMILPYIESFVDAHLSLIEPILAVARDTETGSELADVMDSISSIARLVKTYRNPRPGSTTGEERADRFAELIAAEFSRLGAAPIDVILASLDDLSPYTFLPGAKKVMGKIREILPMFVDNAFSKAVIADALDIVMGD